MSPRRSPSTSTTPWTWSTAPSKLSLFHAHHDERCFLPIHIYDTATGRPVAMILRPGKTPSGREAAGYLRRLHRRIRRHWPTTRLTIRGDGHYGRPELMDFCEKHHLDYLFGVTGAPALHAAVEHAADPIRVERAETGAAAVRGFAETRYAAKSWKAHERRVVARIEATALGLDSAMWSHRCKLRARKRSTPPSTAPVARPRT